jgi:hypothetical protein
MIWTPILAFYWQTRFSSTGRETLRLARAYLRAGGLPQYADLADRYWAQGRLRPLPPEWRYTGPNGEECGGKYDTQADVIYISPWLLDQRKPGQASLALLDELVHADEPGNDVNAEHTLWWQLRVGYEARLQQMHEAGTLPR